MSDLLDRKHPAIRWLEARQFGCRSNPAKAREINAAIDLLFRSRRLLDRHDARMCMRAANKCGVQGPRQRNIGTELRAPVEKALILETGQTGTDAELAHLAAPAAPRTVLPMIIFLP